MMLMGLILLSILAILTFFGFSERFFRKIGIPDWLAFLLVLAFVIGAVVPVIPVGNRVSLSVGGFIIPTVLIVILLSVSPVKKDIFRSVIAVFAVAGITVAAKMLIRPETNSMLLVTAVITGLVGGIVAYLTGGSRIATLVGAVGGIVLGDLTNNLVLRLVYGIDIALGSGGVFDSVVLAAVAGIAVLEVIEAIKRTMNRRIVGKTILNTEAAEDMNFENSREEKRRAEDEKLFEHFEDEE